MTLAQEVVGRDSLAAAGVQALQRAGVRVDVGMVLTGHSDLLGVLMVCYTAGQSDRYGSANYVNAEVQR